VAPVLSAPKCVNTRPGCNELMAVNGPLTVAALSTWNSGPSPPSHVNVTLPVARSGLISVIRNGYGGGAVEPASVKVP